MFENAEKVIRKNLVGVSGPERDRFERQGFRFLFRYGGKKLIWTGVGLIYRGRFREGRELIAQSFKIFLPMAKKDPKLLFQFISAVLKSPLKMKRFSV